MRTFFLCLAWAVSFSPFAAMAADVSIIVPSVASGNGSSTGPFSYPGPVRYQQVYDASAFSQIAAAGGWITQVGFYGEETRPGGFGTITNLQINLSTTHKAPDGLSTIFANNVGQNDTMVFGPAGLSMASSPGDLTLIKLSQQFFYNPNDGNLLLDVRNYSGMGFFPGIFFELDAQSAIGDSVSSAISFDVNSPTALGTGTSGLVTDFIVTPVPEPSTLLLGALGTLSVLLHFQIRRRPRSKIEQKDAF